MKSRTDPKILIAGAGSIGTVVGCLLKNDGLNVKLLRRRGTLGKLSIRLTGVVNETVDIEVYSSKKKLDEQFDIIFLTSQEQHTTTLCQDLIDIIEIEKSTILVSLQNGLKPGKIISSFFPENPLIVGTVWWSATLYNPRLVLYHRKAETYLGIPTFSSASKNDLKFINEMLSKGFNVLETEDINIEVRKKYILNVVSPVLALVKKPYPEGLDDSLTKKLVHAIFDDAVNIAHSLGWDIDDPRLENFHRIISGKQEIPRTKIHDLTHKVSTQIGIEKYGGKGSNASDLLGFFADRGSQLATRLIELISTLTQDYDPLNKNQFNELLGNWRGRCRLDNSRKENITKNRDH